MTGKGGVGKTTISAATAILAASRGTRTLVVSTDAAHSLSDVLDIDLGADVSRIADNLDAVHLDGRTEVSRTWADIARYLRQLLDQAGIGYLQAEELLAIPVLDQLLSLVRLRDLVEQGQWDAVVVDCAPSADSLRLLALPDAVTFYLTRLFGRAGLGSALVRRKFERTFSIPTPDHDVINSIGVLVEVMSRVQSMFASATTTARIVVNPEKIVIAEGRRTLSYLALYGYSVDAVVVNRVLSTELRGTVLQPWLESQQTHMRTIDDVFQCLPRLVVSHQVTEPIGLEALRAVGDELYTEHEPLDVMARVPAMTITAERHEAILRVPVGVADRKEIELYRRDDELFVTLNGYRRAVLLPDSLHEYQVRRAGVADGCLEVVFARNGHA